MNRSEMSADSRLLELESKVEILETKLNEMYSDYAAAKAEHEALVKAANMPVSNPPEENV